MRRVMRMRSRCVSGMSRVLLRKPPTADIHNNARLPLSRRFASSVTASGSASTASPPPLAQPKSLLRRTATVFALGVTFTSLGFAIMAAPALPALNGLLAPPTDAETLKLFTPTDPQEEEVEAFITNSWLAKKMRSKPEFSESRPHLKMPAPFRTNSLTTGTLMGPNRVVVPPFVWAEEGGKSLVSISFLGSELCGYPGIVHGGILATMLDEGLAKCCLAALPHNVGMTANLNINYKAPAMAESYVVLRATTTKVDGRKAWVEGRIETLVPEGETPVVLADATALFISPRQAAMMANVYPTT